MLANTPEELCLNLEYLITINYCTLSETDACKEFNLICLIVSIHYYDDVMLMSWGWPANPHAFVLRLSSKSNNY